MRYQETKTYSQPASVVIGMLTDKDYYLRKYSRLATNVQVLDCSDGDQIFSIRTSRNSRVEVPVPTFAKSMVPSHLTINQTDSWSRATRTGTLAIELKGLPVTITCDMTLTDTATGCLQVLDFNLIVHVPLIGAKLERILADDFRKKFAADAVEGYAAIAEYAG